MRLLCRGRRLAGIKAARLALGNVKPYNKIIPRLLRVMVVSKMGNTTPYRLATTYWNYWVSEVLSWMEQSEAFTIRFHLFYILRSLSRFFETMTTIRPCSPADISKLNLCNLDPLTENYARKFYFDYLATWPTMFIVAENQRGHIVAYGAFAQTLLHRR